MPDKGALKGTATETQKRYDDDFIDDRAAAVFICGVMRNRHRGAVPFWGHDSK